MTNSDAIALVAANGTLPSSELLASLLSHHPYILAADGGANKLLERGIIPNAVLGDFDSVSGDLPDSIERIPAPDQDFTDLDKAIRYLIGRGYETIWLVGATGDRLDHTFGALSILAKYGKLVDIALFDDIGTARLADGLITLEAEIGTTISLIPLGEVTGITTTGLRWNLVCETLSPGVRDGISNEMICTEASVEAHHGMLVVYIHHTSRLTP